MTIAIVWFRQDCRIEDNPALWHAARDHHTVIPVYLYDDSLPWSCGGASRWWLHHSLLALQNSLSALKTPLILRRGPAETELLALIEETHANAVYWNRCYEPAVIDRDARIKKRLKAAQIAVHSYNGSLLLEPWEIVNNAGEYFKVFTPFWKKHQAILQPRPCYPIPVISSTCAIASATLSDWQLLPTKPNWAAGLTQTWQPGEASAKQTLHYFIEHLLATYHTRRDYPATSETSLLSPHLHFGEISPWTIYHAIKMLETSPDYPACATARYLAELGWREFCYSLLFHFPTLPESNFRAHFDNFPWHNNPQHLACWQHGATGYPIIDAGMKQLWHTGYMHNRVRMLAASFLTKHLLIDWRLGAKWFWDTLVDADLANNSGGWQWTAGSGADAAPYFRVFNPTVQGERFDPDGTYVKRWLPQLRHVPSKHIHQPWTMASDAMQSVNLRLGDNYPLPIVDHHRARERALSLYKKHVSRKENPH